MKATRIGAALAVLAVAAVGVLAPSPVSASPSGRCISGQCTQFFNEGGLPISVRHVGGSATLYPGRSTSAVYDWDSFWIPANHCGSFKPPAALFPTFKCGGPRGASWLIGNYASTVYISVYRP